MRAGTSCTRRDGSFRVAGRFAGAASSARPREGAVAPGVAGGVADRVDDGGAGRTAGGVADGVTAPGVTVRAGIACIVP
ncbi:hypothetical protein [Actinomadura sp. 7K507]|uniref:hypothetical protein n=1 Tax=Actinomadura sp. 7K507 TaxID=2530365 RepID=UPI00104380E3|nr:hypothetical protein [Actinomadura sp. 7K507]TDC81114.1 hypothetical protein E1285_33335 [Actinomadura sp. 7K507]